MDDTAPTGPPAADSGDGKAARQRAVPLSVRDLAIPSPRRGSIEALSGIAVGPEQGAEVHAELQAEFAAAHADYRAEVALATTLKAGRFSFRLTGRADGVYAGEPPVIEEIKSAFDLEGLIDRVTADLHHPYVLQLRTYGYLHYLRGGQIPELRLLLVSLRSGERHAHPVALDLPDYLGWLERRLRELERDEKLRRRLALRRRNIAKSLAFPFEAPRPGQRELMASLTAALAEKKHALIQAPTGLGKTMAVLYPTLREALGRASPVVYVTPKNSQHTVAEEAVLGLQATGARLTSLTLTAKKRICMLDEPVCDPSVCKYAKDHYTKVTEADLLHRLARKPRLTAAGLRRLAEKHEVCPYELAAEASQHADVVICDYNYVIDSQTLATRISAGLRARGAAPSLVIDEAHNFFVRACDNLSAVLSRRELTALLTELNAAGEPSSTEGTRLCREITRQIDMARIAARSGKEHGASLIDFHAVERLEAASAAFLAAWLRQTREISGQAPALRLVNLWQAFAEAVGRLSARYVPLHESDRDDERLRIICCDASDHLREMIAPFAHVVAFSATLKPFDYFARLSGFDLTSLHTGEFASPFPRANRKVLVIPQISTRLRDRGRETERIAEVINRVVAVHPGNYAAFFPSYSFMAAVLDRLALPPEMVLLRQSPGMAAREVKASLTALGTAGRSHLVMAVQGGALAEGVDFKGDLLVGAFIVGPGIPTADRVREILRAYYEREYGRGDDYAYTFPAMTRVVQAAGRVIRSETDRGLIVLMDRRFMEPRFADLMPAGWYESSVKELESRRILHDVRTFWDAAAPEEPRC